MSQKLVIEVKGGSLNNKIRRLKSVNVKFSDFNFEKKKTYDFPLLYDNGLLCVCPLHKILLKYIKVCGFT